MIRDLGYIRVGCVVPSVEVSNVNYNVSEIIRQIRLAKEKNVEIVSFPELAITSYTCGDLFFQDILLEDSLKGLKRIVDETSNLNIISIVGLPLKLDNQLFNVAAVINKGNILGIVPKTYIPNYSEFYEKRWFNSSSNLLSDEIELFGKMVPIGTNLIFQEEKDSNVSFGIEICEDLWSVLPPSNNHVLNGANMIFNLSASNEIIGKDCYRKNLVKMQSAKCVCAYIYASSGIGESTSDVVFSGSSMIAEDGTILKEGKRFNFDSNLIYSDIDIKRLAFNRYKNISFMGVKPEDNYRKINFKLESEVENLDRVYKKYPFVPTDTLKRDERCREIISIQACGLAKRLKATKNQKTIIGISGGLDSTLAFLVIVEAYKKLGIDNKNIIAVTMPGFGTTDRTYQNALSLIKNYGATLKEINIKEACLLHFKDIGQDPKQFDITYENAQARERTQILMDLANKEHGLVIGTGDLSELVLGWCTYNGDHMSMYAVNTSIPKTLVRYLVKWVADINEDAVLKKTIYDILDTPISPELLPPDKTGKIKQLTEDSVGPYILHDFFLYHFLRYGASLKKILYIASLTFKDMYTEEEIKFWLERFVRRFFTQQFKRNCLPDGPKVGTISVSPRGDLRMPSDASYEIWFQDINR